MRVGSKAYERVHFALNGAGGPVCEEKSSSLTMVQEWKKVTCFNCRAEKP